MEKKFPQNEADGHPVHHPVYGHVDDIRVSGTETPAELAAYETAVFRRLGLPVPDSNH